MAGARTVVLHKASVGNDYTKRSRLSKDHTSISTCTYHCGQREPFLQHGTIKLGKGT